MKSFDYLIIGGGVAGHRAAEEIRKADPTGSVVIISDESHRLYSRVLLSHVLHGKVPRERVFLVKPEWYAEQKIELISLRSVVQVDDKNSTVVLDDGAVLGFKKLLLASGGHVRKLALPNPNQLYFRTLDDADLIQNKIKGLRAGLPVSVIGSGFIALEFINLFAARGLKQDVWFRANRFWQRALNEQSSAFLENRMRNAGITLHLNASEPEIAHGTSEAALVGIGIGSPPSFSFLKGIGVKTGQGILTNEYLEASVPNIWAAGDVAEYRDVVVGRDVLVGNWMNADLQGRHAGRAMAGTRAPFRLVSSYATKLLDIHIISIGDPELSAADKVEVDQSGDGIIQRLYRGGKLVGATLVNTAKERAELTKIISDHKS